MQSPDPPIENGALPTSVGVPDELSKAKSPSDNVSLLTNETRGGLDSLSSPIGAADLGIPKTPDQRVIQSVDNTLTDQGYDSDGFRPPWEESQVAKFVVTDLEEDCLPCAPPPVSSVIPIVENVAQNLCTTEDVHKMSVKDLKAELKKRKLAITGLKDALKLRLIEAIKKGVPVTADIDNGKLDNFAGDAFSPGAYWEELKCEGEVIEEDMPDGFRAPTVPAGETPFMKKRNYEQVFDRMVFTGVTEVPRLYKNNRIAKDKNGNVLFDKKACTETLPKISWVRKNKLSINSHPFYWFEAMLNVRRKDKETICTIEDFLEWTNLRAIKENAGLGGKYGKDWTPFTLDELMKHIGLYLFQGLSPSPQVEMKFYSQSEDPVNGNDFIKEAFGGMTGVSQRRHRHFKSFFTSVDPTIPVPDRDTHPNWKVHPFLKHILDVSQKAVFMGRDLSCDEQTIGFQGHHKDKQRITYKKEGDGFLADTICGDGYTYAFFFRHQRVTSKMQDGLQCSPLHARVIALCAQLPDKYYTLGMDNLYMSTKLARLCYSIKQKVMIHGVTRPSLRGIPPIVKQEEVKRKSDLEKVRHTVKGAILKGDEVCTNLIALSVYDTKPVYFLSNACEGIKWMKKLKKVYDPAKQKTIDLPFYRLELIDFYNKNMGNVDLADQLRNHYRYDTSWHRNRKWWWSIWWWGFQVLLTNSYILYKKYHEMIKSKEALSHYDYIKEISLAWIDRNIIANKLEENYNDLSDKILTRRAKRKLDTDTLSVTSKCTNVDDKSLHPGGKLNIRLNNSFQHLPVQSNGKRPRCALHRWARNRKGPEVMKNVVCCSICRVNLCISCYSLFHKEADLFGMKDEIAAKESVAV